MNSSSLNHIRPAGDPRSHRPCKRILKADISRIKRVVADSAAMLPASIVECTLQDAKDVLNLLAVHARQLTRWQTDTISDAERAEVVRLRAIIPEIRL